MSALPELEADGSERRIAQRTRTLKRAKVIFNNGFSTFDCIVRNISATGALLTIDEAAHLPKTFEVRIGEDKDTRPARLVYRRGMFAGIRFLDIETDDEADAVPGLAAAPGGAPVRETSHAAGSIRRIEPETLPAALKRHFPWA